MAIVQGGTPQRSLSWVDVVALILGIVIGAGIFETPALVAANTGSHGMIIFVWLLGGLISLMGALCYAELATTYPHVGGNYYYLKRAFGNQIAFLFAWARMTVVQTGSIALLAFVFGDYASQLWSFGPFSASIYAACAIVGFTLLNLGGLQPGKWAQNGLTIATVLGLLLIVVIGLVWATPTTAVIPASTTPTFGLAMVFVLLTYGGWNEAVYLSAEIEQGNRNMVRSLVWSLGIITALYLLVNLAYLRGLGLGNMAASKAVGADLLRQVLGQPGAIVISLLVVAAALSSLNGTIFTGARSNYALGQDFSLFGFMGRWRSHLNTPSIALLLQGGIALALVLLGTITRKGFESMVDYTAPVFWFFFLLSGISLFVLRVREPQQVRPFCVPFYPWLPLFFCLTCGYLLYSSLAYTGIGAGVGVAVVLLGIPFFYWSQQRRNKTAQ